MKVFYQAWLLFTIYIYNCELYAQNSFTFISNDTTFQDYIQLIYAPKSENTIIALGSNIIRNLSNDSIYNCPTFIRFDYFGNVLLKKKFHYIDKILIKHFPPIPHTIYTNEFLNNPFEALADNRFLVADMGIDTALKQSKLILLELDSVGEIKLYNSMDIENNSANPLVVKHVIQLKSGFVLVVLWDEASGYTFQYLNKDLTPYAKNTLNLPRGIRAIKEIEDGDFVCTSLKVDKSAFQFYRLDTSNGGNIKWINTLYNSIDGTGRGIEIRDDKIYIVGSTGTFGAFIISDFNGNILKELNINNFYCRQRFYDAYIENMNSFFISGYIQHCDTNDSSGYDLCILNMDSTGTINWSEIYNFKSALGTSDNGKYDDYGGSSLIKTNDGGLITNGISVYKGIGGSGVLHNDAILVKTLPKLTNNSTLKNTFQLIGLKIKSTPQSNILYIEGSTDAVLYWSINDLSGKILLIGKKLTSDINVTNLVPGIYYLHVLSKNGILQNIKFIVD